MTVTRNRIFRNGGLAIRFYQPSNGGVQAPAITDVTAGGASGVACAGCLVELFSDEDSQAEVFEGWARAGADGGWTVPKPSRFTGRYLTATATDGFGNTSELSAPVLAAPAPTATSSPGPSPTGTPTGTPGPSPTHTATLTATPARLFIPRVLQSWATPSLQVR